METFGKIAVAYAALLASTDITIERDTNYSGSYTGTDEVTDSDRQVKEAVQDGINATTMQVKISPTVNSNDGPEIESIKIDYT